MTTLVFLLEEPSARDLIEGLLPRLVGEDVEAAYIVFEGKQDLEKRMVGRMRAWQKPDSKFIVLRDQDSGDCHSIKAGLRERADAAGKPDALIRVACRTLESWVVGDWTAVAETFEKPALAQQANKAKFRDPDVLHDPVRDLRTFLPEYQKRDGARRVGTLLDPERSQSHSFKVFCRGVAALAGGDAP